MNTLLILRRFVSSWKSLLSGLIALAIYLCLPPIIRWYDPTAAVFDGGYLQWVGFAAFLVFFGVFVGTAAWQIAFSVLDKLTAGKAGEWANLEAWTESLTPLQKVLLVQGTHAFCILLFFLALKLVPL